MKDSLGEGGVEEEKYEWTWDVEGWGGRYGLGNGI